MKNIWLIRHGESLSNVGKKTDYPHTVGLTERGFKQADQIARQIKEKPELVIHTPYIRTLQSSRPILKKYPDVKVEEWPLQEFIYLDPKLYHNTTRDERKMAKVQFWEKCDPYYSNGNGSESFCQFQTRLKKCLKKLRTRKGLVLVYTHGHVLRNMIWYVLNGKLECDAKSFKRYRSLRTALSVPNGAIIKLNLNSREWAMSTILTGHLK